MMTDGHFLQNCAAVEDSSTLGSHSEEIIVFRENKRTQDQTPSLKDGILDEALKSP